MIFFEKKLLNYKKGVVFTQFLVESTTELCLLDGPEGGIGVPLGKKLNICPWYRKPISCFLRKVVIETLSSTIMVVPGLMAKLEPARSIIRKITYMILESCLVHGSCLDWKESDDEKEGAIWRSRENKCFG